VEALNTDMATPPTIILYDTPSKDNVCWSPNTWKARLALAYKAAPFATEWVQYPDIKPTFPHLSTPEKPVVTLPIIKTEKGALVTDSWDIAEYLEAHFPGERPLFKGGKEPHYFFQKYVETVVLSSLKYILLPKTPDILAPVSAEYFRRTRREWYGVSLEEWAAQDQKPYFEDLRKALTPIHLTLEKTKKFLGGEEITYSDIILFSIYLWVYAYGNDLLEKFFQIFPGDVEKEWFKRNWDFFHIEELQKK